MGPATREPQRQHAGRERRYEVGMPGQYAELTERTDRDCLFDLTFEHDPSRRNESELKRISHRRSPCFLTRLAESQPFSLGARVVDRADQVERLLGQVVAF